MCVVYDRIPEVGTVSSNQRHLNVFFHVDVTCSIKSSGIYQKYNVFPSNVVKYIYSGIFSHNKNIGILNTIPYFKNITN